MAGMCLRFDCHDVLCSFLFFVFCEWCVCENKSCDNGPTMFLPMWHDCTPMCEAERECFCRRLVKDGRCGSVSNLYAWTFCLRFFFLSRKLLPPTLSTHPVSRKLLVFRV
uniref:Secreted protein n=1 Tax=Rhipicephalus appendiculatus TaxID=34631 RepID=A0A131YD45_RHIAP